MTIRRWKPVAASIGLLFSVNVSGCNRAAARIPGASLSFPPTSTRTTAQTSYPYSVVVTVPLDARSKHYGERVGGTEWTGCSTDPFWQSDVPALIQDRITTELAESKLFVAVSKGVPKPGDMVLRSEIHALCSQAIGFVYLRVAGISSLKMTVERDGKLLLEDTFERVVTDADTEYTGSQVTFIEPGNGRNDIRQPSRVVP